ncbi:MAG: sulfatase-like hydrolase/transferase [Gemmataceae bacterium]|nr:sulfatase-like hydrolase/transferase [Gemmataceae bacterium]
MKRWHLLPFLVALVGLLCPAPAQAGPPKKKPLNIISIVTDDQGRWAVGAYGNREVKTPNMDRLAREGAKFVHAFTATPVCSPSRATFLSGRYGSQVGITDWIAPVEAEGGAGLPQDALTWAEVLRRAGYVTALVGKWHLGMLPQFHPTRRGFDHFFGFLGGGNTPMNPTLEEKGKQKKFKGPLPDILVDDAIGFIKANRERPFALLLHFRAPHLPYGPVPAEDAAPFKDLDPTVPQAPGADVAKVKKLTRDYYASVHSVDRNLGRLFAALEALGLLEHTIILFTSDHGYMIGHHGLHSKGNAFWIAGGVNGPKRPNMFDDAIRVPLLIRWPGAVKPGTEIREMVCNVDTFASVLGMLGVPAPANYKHQGRDFSPLLRGEKVAWRDAHFSQYDLHNGGLAYMRSIRTARYHLVRHHFTNLLDELYDLDQDPGELRNLYKNPKYRAVRDQLQERLTAWQRSIDDPILRKAGK